MFLVALWRRALRSEKAAGLFGEVISVRSVEVNLGLWANGNKRGRGLAANGTRAPRGVVSSSPGRMASYDPAFMLHKSFTNHLHWLITSFWYHIKQIITCSSNHVSTLRTSLGKPRSLIKTFRRNFSFKTWKCFFQLKKKKKRFD